MKKFLIIGLILIITLTSEQAIDIYTNKLKSTNIIYHGVDYQAFNFDNAKILQAREIVRKDVTKKYHQMQLSDKIKTYGIIGAIIIIIVETTIILVK